MNSPANRRSPGKRGGERTDWPRNLPSKLVPEIALDEWRPNQTAGNLRQC
jgi:hypothetical protein